MAIKNRVPKSETDKKEMAFIGAIEQDNLKTLSLEQLAQQFDDVEQQGQLLQGRILLEARERFRSDKEFGQWCSQSICLGSQPQRTRLMNLARFFEGRELEKISISAAYEISAPINADIANEIYEIARGKNMPLAEVRRQIALKKGVPNVSIVPTSVEPSVEKTSAAEMVTESLPIEINQSQIVTSSIEKSKQELIMAILEGLTSGEAKKLLRDCLYLIKW